MSGAEFMRTIAAVQPSPCEAFQCCCRAQCAAQLLACHAFAAYVITGRSAHPSAVVKQGPSGRLDLERIDGGPPSPTARLYQRLYARRDTPDGERFTILEP